MSAAQDLPGSSDRDPVDLLVDWDLAARTATALAGTGPEADRREVRAAVAALRAGARAASAHVARTTRLDVPPAGRDVLVVDRAGWVRANVDGFRELLAPVIARAWEQRTSGKRQSPAVLALGRRATGAEVGALLAFMGTRVLGQYDAFRGLDRGEDGGRLLLVAPNVVAVERDLQVDPADFRLWVCLHEETHRVQFAAAPWLRHHLAGEVRALVGDLLGEPGDAAERVLGALRRLPAVLRDGEGSTSLLDLVQTPEQAARLDAVTAVMSLLEGHADVVMDDVGPQVVPSVAVIRERFDRRRAGAGPVDVLLRRLLGLEAKARQYREGARFVRGVQAEVGVDGFNRVWSGPDALPRPEEVADPAAWVRRLHG